LVAAMRARMFFSRARMFFSHFLKVFSLRPLRLCGELLRKISVNQRLSVSDCNYQVQYYLAFLHLHFSLIGQKEHFRLLQKSFPSLKSAASKSEKSLPLIVCANQTFLSALKGSSV